MKKRMKINPYSVSGPLSELKKLLSKCADKRKRDKRETEFQRLLAMAEMVRLHYQGLSNSSRVFETDHDRFCQFRIDSWLNSQNLSSRLRILSLRLIQCEDLVAHVERQLDCGVDGEAGDFELELSNLKLKLNELKIAHQEEERKVRMLLWSVNEMVNWLGPSER
ncbi:MAG TPA: hypothetical protein V6D17_03375 [Candidatus Obscuribacterales bacterium]